MTEKSNPIEVALEPAREQARFHAKRQAEQRVAHIKNLLESNGWDRAKACPYPRGIPHGTMNFYVARGLYDDATFLTRISGVNSMNGPCIVNMERNRVKAFIKRWIDETDMQYTAFVAKMVHKIGTCKAATLVGNHVWSYSILTVVKASGVERWKTQQIINVSKLGKTFPQWPSRKVK